MFLYAFFLGLIASVSATSRPRDDTPEPELIATPSNFANATARHGFVNARSLDARQLFCDSGYHACSGTGCCRNTEYCVVVQGQLGCCPNGRVCNRPPQGPPRCTDSGYFLCPSQDYCCPNGANCKRDINNNPECEWPNSLPPPTTTYEQRTTSTNTYDYWTTSTSTYSYNTATIETTSAYISFPRSSPTTMTSTKSSSGDSNTFSVLTADTTTSLRSDDAPLPSSAQNIIPGYSVTGVMFFLVVTGLL